MEVVDSMRTTLMGRKDPGKERQAVLNETWKPEHQGDAGERPLPALRPLAPGLRSVPRGLQPLRHGLQGQPPGSVALRPGLQREPLGRVGHPHGLQPLRHGPGRIVPGPPRQPLAPEARRHAAERQRKERRCAL